MYIDYYLKFDSAEQAQQVLFVDATPKYAAVDLIGTIYKPTSTMIETEFGPQPEMQAIQGYHANVRHVDAAPELDIYAVQPSSPIRVWA